MDPRKPEGRQSPEPAGVRDRFPALYSELRTVAERLLGNHKSPSLAATDLLHEAFVKLRDEEARRLAGARSALGDKPDEAFKACFGAACRDVLVDRVRKRLAQKRGGGQPNVVLDSTILVPDKGEADALEIHDAISALADFDPQLAQLVEARVFGELSVPECAEFFQMSPRTIDRRWAFALEWLRDRLQ